MDAGDLKETGQAYKDNLINWQYFRDSYLGGASYKKGKYLHQYVLETGSEYDKRVDQTPLDNHCRNIVSVYSSFLWRQTPTRNYGSLAGDVALTEFLEDVDLDGRSFDSFMQEAQQWASVYGHVWLMMDKPRVNVTNRKEELELGIRPYINIIKPLAVLDWKYERQINGAQKLVYFKVRESVSIYRIWTPEMVQTWETTDGEKKAKLIDEVANALGKIPVVYLPNTESDVAGVGISDLTDVADLQKSIYNELSEIEQLIRLSNHPTLCKTPSVDASAGAGAILEMSEDMEPALKPYMLQPTGQNLAELRASIRDKVETINRITHMGSVRATENQTKSGIALQTEFMMLNAKLSEKARALALAEEQLWRIFFQWQGKSWDGEIIYPQSFDLRDQTNDLLHLQQAKASGVASPTFIKELDKQIAELMIDDDEMVTAIAKEIDG